MQQIRDELNQFIATKASMKEREAEIISEYSSPDVKRQRKEEAASSSGTTTISKYHHTQHVNEDRIM